MHPIDVRGAAPDRKTFSGGVVICLLWLAGCGAGAAGGGGSGGMSTAGTGGMLGGGSGGAPSSTGSGGSAGGGSGGTATGGGSGGAAVDAPVIQPADAGPPPTDTAQGACTGGTLKPGTSTQMLSFGGGM